jgi:hypothetical protein
MSSEGRRTFTINNSSSKQQYKFSKSSRFSVSKANTRAFGYELPGFFGHKSGSGAGKGFSSSQGRFQTYKANSHKVDGPGQIDRNGNDFGQTNRYSFGVSRDDMKKCYVDEITKQGKDHPSPGPDKYEAVRGFGNGNVFGTTNKSGSRYSMRPKNDLFVHHLDRQRKLPGPGNYHDSVNLAGKASACLNSRLQNQPQNCFPKASDRFRITGQANPAGADYMPKADLNQNVKS